jgi:hypothetical protein
LAHELAHRYGYQYLTTDNALDYFLVIEDDATRLLFGERFYASILGRWPDGLVIEGDDFILENRVTYAKTDHAIAIDPAIRFAERFGIELFLLGNCHVSAEDRIQAYEEYSSKAECWTTELRDVRKYASRRPAGRRGSWGRRVPRAAGADPLVQPAACAGGNQETRQRVGAHDQPSPRRSAPVPRRILASLSLPYR